jgi:hypothetical protein
MRLTLGQILPIPEPLCNGNVIREADARPNHGAGGPKGLEKLSQFGAPLHRGITI